jgi:hypothetical protein
VEEGEVRVWGCGGDGVDLEAFRCDIRSILAVSERFEPGSRLLSPVVSGEEWVLRSLKVESSALPCLGGEAEVSSEMKLLLTTRLLAVTREVLSLFTPTTFVLFFHAGHHSRLASLTLFSM